MQKKDDDQTSLTELNNQSEMQYQLADWHAAVKYANSMSLRKQIGESLQKYELFCSNQIFKRYGIGLFFYFDLLQKLSIVFWILTLIAIPSFYSNLTGYGLSSESTSGFTITQIFSIANQPRIEILIPPNNSTLEGLQKIQIQIIFKKQSKRKGYVWIPDFTYSVVFLIFIIYYFRFQDQVTKDYQYDSFSPSSYAIEIKGLPDNLYDSNELKSFLNQICISRNICSQQDDAVVEIALAKNFQGILYLYKQEVKLRDKIKIEMKKLEIIGHQNSSRLIELKNQLKLVQDNINEVMIAKIGKNIEYQYYKTVKAYVIFNSLSYKMNFISLMEKYNCNLSYFFFCNRLKVPSDLKFRGIHQLQVNDEVDQPSNIKWENLDMTLGQYAIKKIFLLIAIVLLLLFTSVMIILANILKQLPKSKYPEFISSEEVKQLIDILSTSTIVVINYLIQIILRKFSKYIRYQTVTKEVKVTTFYTFLCTFINTTIISVLMQSDIFGFILAMFMTSPIPSLHDIQKQKIQQFSPDFDRNWYESVGTNIILTILINTISPHLLYLLFITPIQAYFRRQKAKQVMIQREMNKLLIGSKFDIAVSYVNVLNIVFVCLFFSSGQPLLLGLGAISISTQYMCQKYSILRIHQKPPGYDQTLNQMVLNILPLALVFHLAIGIYMYGQPFIFPKSPEDIKIEIQNKLNSNGIYNVNIFTNEEKPIEQRAYSSVILFILLSFCSILTSANLFFGKFAKKAYNLIEKTCCLRYRALSRIITLSQIRSQISFTKQKHLINSTMLASYDIRNNQKYSYLINALNMNYILSKISRGTAASSFICPSHNQSFKSKSISIYEQKSDCIQL